MLRARAYGPELRRLRLSGLVIVQSTDPSGGRAGSDHWTVVRSNQVPEKEDFDPNSCSFDGEVYSGCDIDTFPATVEVPIDSNSPEVLSERYSPEGPRPAERGVGGRTGANWEARAARSARPAAGGVSTLGIGQILDILRDIRGALMIDAYLE